MKEGMLSPYRVLDLADEKGQFCGKLLGDLGADVIKIEKPGGDPSRSIGPFYNDDPHPEKGLHWYAFNTSKRGITLDIATRKGSEIFRRLVQSADAIVESFPPDNLDELGLGYAALREINPGIVLVSITPFGQTGPYKDYKAPDIVAWGLGGEMFPFGDEDRPPIRISHHSQAYLHAGLEAAVGGMIALYRRALSGQGEHVDVSVQEAVAHRAHHVTGMWDMEKLVLPHGLGVPLGHIPDSIMAKVLGKTERKERISLWPCKDGFISWIYWFGPMATKLNAASIKWMQSEGLDDPFVLELDASQIDLLEVTPEIIERIQGPMKAFFRQRTKAELLEGALEHGVILYPVSTTRDILEDAHRKHLDARAFWVELDHPELGRSMTYPGPFCSFSETPLEVSRRAPLIGEHNRDIYEKELGIEVEEMVLLKAAGVI